MPDDLLGRDPAKLCLALQPHLTLLEMGYPLDDFVIAVKKKGAMRTEASNAAETDRREAPLSRPARLPKSQPVFLGVYRYQNSIYYKRMTEEALRLLQALGEGAPVAEACAIALASVEGDEAEWAGRLKEWFAAWTELGWLCKQPKKR